jgi:CRP-like cAMP-binding protein
MSLPPTSLNPLVRKLGRFESLSQIEVQVLEELSNPARNVEGHQDIVREGERPKHSTVLLEGFIYRYKILQDGGRQILCFQIPGDFVDLHGFLLPSMDHAVSTLTPCTVASVPHDKLREITEKHPRLTRALWRDVAVDGSIFREWMVGIGRRDARQRIAHLICELLHRLDAIGLVDQLGYALPLTQAEFADAVGVSNVHVNRVLRDLHKANVVTFTKHRIEIRDVKQLAQIADFEPGYLQL